MLTSRLHELPEPIQAELFTALDIQVLWNAPQHQATFFATITDTNISDINALLDRGKDDPATTMPTPASHHPDQQQPRDGIVSPPYLPKSVPESGVQPNCGGNRDRVT